TVDAERVKHWIAQGAEPTDTMHNFLISQKIITGKKRNVLPKKSPIKKEEKAGEAKAEAPKEEVKKEEKTEVPAETPKA
ncbi:MAG: 30S ribosomal protein S16, partial [Candidatus Pacebacteria bacterium]|nr:30S ribosomal protein S16 [Candidatus Paceibacterota bacterium]